ncbi:ribbon-helix-helix domain-containing protein [Roseibium aggregatum]|uniref:CopG family transcriptional regulator n=1 Tax=Roseibium aggregatum TaxID=187304 RepID=A0A926P5X7_9HYPH|nr:CopG family transcriptional regulator [Roseibium aggregatum]MBD1548162.1 CopG family transcriptional regulator [Roseibium aggregatum]
MSRQSISLTRPNDEWLKAQVESEEYSSKSEVINDLIRKAREMQEIRKKLIAAEASGFSNRTPEQIRADARAKLRNAADL